MPEVWQSGRRGCWLGGCTEGDRKGESRQTSTPVIKDYPFQHPHDANSLRERHPQLQYPMCSTRRKWSSKALVDICKQSRE
ncbi:hypothetical protein H2248_011877 [Termitomyces sp. 'cryptogamus']|nr:hypothetical protein H2248_011877 [Termitomyces sp. 'cryptogamus']